MGFSPGQEELPPSLLSELCGDQALMPLGEEFGPCIWFLWFIWPMRARSKPGWQQRCFLRWDLGLRKPAWCVVEVHHLEYTFWRVHAPHTLQLLYLEGGRCWLSITYRQQGLQTPFWQHTIFPRPSHHSTKWPQDLYGCSELQGNLGGHSMDHPTLNTPGLMGWAAHRIAQLVRDVSPLPACDRSPEPLCLCLEKSSHWQEAKHYFLCPD